MFAQQKNYTIWKTIASKTKKRLSLHGWLPNIVIGIVLLLVGPVIGGLMRNPRIAIISAAIGVTIFIWVIALVAYKSAPTTKVSQVEKGKAVADRPVAEEIRDAERNTKKELTEEMIDSNNGSNSKQKPLTSQTAVLKDSPGSEVYQAGRDIIVNPPSTNTENRIRSLTLEIRLTCIPKEMHGELPPDEVNFMPMSDANAYLDGPAGKQRLVFVSPVRFRKLTGGKIVVVNRFTIDPSGELFNQPVRVLANFDKINVPVITIVWGKELEKFTLLELSLSLNGQDPAYASWPYDQPFQEGPLFTFDFKDLRMQLMDSSRK